jgi:hypothetical protein
MGSVFAMIVAKVTAVMGVAGLVAAAVGAVGSGTAAVAAVLLLVGAVTGAIALEERDSIEGLVVQELSQATTDDEQGRPIAA